MKNITLQDLCLYCDDLLACGDFTDFCPNGLQIEASFEIEKIGTAVSASLETIEKAVDLKLDALIVHHGIFWKGDNFPIFGIKRKKIELLLKNNISLLAYHLPLDAHPFLGNNWKAALDLGWENLSPFGFQSGKFIGVKGTFPQILREEFSKKLEKYYNHPANVALGGKNTVSSAALISGGAYKSLSEAALSDVDCFITGNYDEPAWNDAHELNMNFFAMGHSATERIGPIALGEHLSMALGLESLFIDVYNPF